MKACSLVKNFQFSVQILHYFVMLRNWSVLQTEDLLPPASVPGPHEESPVIHFAVSIIAKV